MIASKPVHVPVLLKETVQWLDIKPGMVVVDGTVGAGGHSRAIQKQLGGQGTLIGLDRDPMMLELAREALSAENLFLRQSSYADLPSVLEELEIEKVDRILLDLGLSSDQLAHEERGFGFQTTGLLDMRFDMSQGKPAWRLLQDLSEAELTQIFFEYGEERSSRRIARAIVAQREQQPVKTVTELLDVVSTAVGAANRPGNHKHPATRIFQALRIAVNEELEHLTRSLSNGLHKALAPTGRLAVITFHSLEDRITKNAFRDSERWEMLTRKPIIASPAEIRMNPRSRTAKLRVAATNQ